MFAVVLLVAFLVMMVGIGIWGMKKTSTVQDFFLGGRSIGPWVSAFAYGMTYFSAVVFIGFAGKLGWGYGLDVLWIAVGNAVERAIVAASMTHRRFNPWRGALLATALLGCGTEGKIKAFVAQERPAIDRNLAAWPAIAEQLRTLPPLEKNGIEGQHKLIVDTLSDTGKFPTVSLCYAEDLANPDELGHVWGRMSNTGNLNECASLLHRGHFAYDPAKPELPLKSISMAEALRRFPRCAAYRYLLVIRTLEFLPPSTAVKATSRFLPITETLSLDAIPVPPPPAPTPSKKRQRGSARVAKAAEPAEPPSASKLRDPAVDTSQLKETRYLFEGGMLRAEALLFALPTAKLLGGVRFAAQNGVELSGTDDEVKKDLQQQLKSAMVAAIKTGIPDADLQGADF